MEPVGEKILQLDTVLLATMACKASGRKNLRLEGWQAQKLSGGAELGSTIQRISGEGTADGESVPWSLILKTITCVTTNSGSPQASHFWKREPYYYQSGLLDALPVGLRAPRCYACFEHSGCEQPGSFQLFLEYIGDAFNGSGSGHSWPLPYFRTAARCLGQFNGAYLMETLIPKAEWIPRNWFKAYIEEATPKFDPFFSSLRLPIPRRFIRSLSPDLIGQAWEQRHEIYAALDRLPKVFCHNDAFSRNLFAENTPTGDRLVAVDWSYAGPGPLGFELVALVSASLGMEPIPFTESNQLTQLALDGYLEGLGDVGWHGNPDLVRFAFSAGCFWRYLFGMLIGENTEYIVNEANYPSVEKETGISMEQLADSIGVWMDWSMPYYEETMRLKKALNL